MPDKKTDTEILLYLTEKNKERGISYRKTEVEVGFRRNFLYDLRNGKTSDDQLDIEKFYKRYPELNPSFKIENDKYQGHTKEEFEELERKIKEMDNLLEKKRAHIDFLIDQLKEQMKESEDE